MFGLLKKKGPAPESKIKTIRSSEEFSDLLEHSRTEPVVLFKHSAACGTSLFARREIELLDAPTDPPVYEVVVQQSRALSNQIAEEFGIRHESPQAIIVQEGKPVWSDSHGRVTRESVRSAVGKDHSMP